jgi:hypothetical protein
MLDSVISTSHQPSLQRLSDHPRTPSKAIRAVPAIRILLQPCLPRPCPRVSWTNDVLHLYVDFLDIGKRHLHNVQHLNKYFTSTLVARTLFTNSKHDTGAPPLVVGLLEVDDNLEPSERGERSLPRYAARTHCFQGGGRSRAQASEPHVLRVSR